MAVGRGRVLALVLAAAGALALLGRPHAGESGAPDALLGARSGSASGATRVADKSLASSILHSARRKFLARKSIAKRHAAHRAAAAPTSLDGFTLDKKAQAALEGKKLIDSGAPTSSLLTRMPVANSAKGVIAAAAYLDSQKTGAAKGGAKKKRSRAAQLEYDIAHHKLTTRGLVAAVKEVQHHQEKELGTSLQDQTDDLIIAKINQLRGSKARSSSTQNYVLNNALTKGEQATLSNPKDYSTKSAAAAAAAAGPVAAVPGPRAAAAPGVGAGSRGRIQRANPAILKATSGSKGGDPEGLLSSYDQQLLAGGPQSITTASLSAPSPPNASPPRQQQLSQIPPAQAPPMQPYAPPPAQTAYQQPPREYAPEYAPQYGYAQPAAYGQPAYGQYAYQGGYAAPAPYATQYPQYPQYPQYQPYAQAGYQQPGIYGQAYQGAYAQPAYAPPAFAARPAYAAPQLAAAAPAAEGGGAPPAVRVSRAQLAEVSGAVSHPSALGAILPKHAKGLPDAKKAEIAAQMKALRESIEADFDATKSKGDKAGYLPPPPMP